MQNICRIEKFRPPYKGTRYGLSSQRLLMKEKKFSCKDTFVLGIAITPLIIIIYAWTSESSSKMSDYSNVIIAIATIVATYIHITSEKRRILERLSDIDKQREDQRQENEKRRKERLWDINKKMLLDLSDALSKVIHANNYEIDKHTLSSSGNGEDVDQLGEEPDGAIYPHFDKTLDYAVRVYKPLMNKSLIEKCDNLVRTNNNFKIATKEMEMEVIDAIEQINALYEDVLHDLQEYIIDISGIGEMKD